ncbi:MAG TPA: cation:proton antiporter, partial [Polyangiaceae bacterium]|nr:cation:proton antiporter [Polyangiaceae bacterium]
TDPPSSIVLQFVGTFAVWTLADRAGLSGVLTIVAYAVTIARNASARMPARLRVPSFAVWDTIVFVLNVLAFVLIGLQIRPILEHLSSAQRARDLGFAGAVLATVVVIRVAWVMAYNTVVRWKIHRFGVHQRRPMMRPTAKSGLLIAWCGMRGIVTLAAALALPEGFPQRDLIVLTSFAVVVGTLLVQGLTLKPLVLWLDLRDDNPVEREVRQGWTRALESALDSLKDDESPEADALRGEYATALQQITGEPEPELSPSLPSDALRRQAVAAARATVTELRARGDIGDDAFHALQEELDRLELSAE